MNSELKINTLFLALTRPAMTMGVTHEYFIVSLLFSLSVFIFANNIFYGLVWIPVHIAGVLMHKKDHQFLKLQFAYAKVPSSKNTKHWGVRCYEPY